MENLIAFIVGFATDMARSVFLPQTTDWLRRRMPGGQEKANFEENDLRLSVMAKLKALGKDPHLIEMMGDAPDVFMRHLTAQQDVFAEYLVERIDKSGDMTQLEMNMAAAEASELSATMVGDILEELKGLALDPLQLEELATSQAAWQNYADAHASFVAGKWRGGSAQPVIFYGELERLRLDRVGELKSLLDEWREM